MRLLWTENAWQEYRFWQETDPSMTLKINELIKDAKRSPFKGLGKPEPLKGDLSGFGSRRISGEHRFVYRVAGKGEFQQLVVVQCRFHYK
ncbi:Txe/YoeB family addiction module toxin [Martelella alba]|uniref:Putative mRNA interferase YoeB n=1 Tax=Martelella alba TaxID=2590451 RepID=A0ABY2SJT5_9HYPH|nr:Txe/YoeB family addiction module toxin [Martelella alba]TKI05764.1 Txe/YoeB family addiction module toxin [Martelella alba]